MSSLIREIAKYFNNPFVGEERKKKLRKSLIAFLLSLVSLIIILNQFGVFKLLNAGKVVYKIHQYKVASDMKDRIIQSYFDYEYEVNDTNLNDKDMLRMINAVNVGRDKAFTIGKFKPLSSIMTNLMEDAIKEIDSAYEITVDGKKAQLIKIDKDNKVSFNISYKGSEIQSLIYRRNNPYTAKVLEPVIITTTDEPTVATVKEKEITAMNKGETNLNLICINSNGFMTLFTLKIVVE